MAIKAITFDFWRTLFRDAHGEKRRALRAEALSAATGKSADEAAAALEAVNAVFQQHHVEHMATLYPMDAVRLTCDRLNVDLPAEDAARMADIFAMAIVQHSPVPIEGALEAVQTAAAHRPVGLVSDAGLSPGRALRVLLDRHGFTPHFTTMAFSDEVGVAKPQAPMFETAARGLGVAPRELLHIGDLEYTDIVGAKAVGAVAVLFAGDNTRHLGATEAAHSFTNWDDFREALPGLLNGAA